MRIHKKRLLVLAAIGVGLVTALAACSAGANGCKNYGSRAAVDWNLEHPPGQRDPQHLASALHLSPEQQPVWEAYVATLSTPTADLARGGAEASAPQRLESALAWTQAREQAASTRLAAMKALYAQLTPEQRKVFDAPTHFFARWHQ